MPGPATCGEARRPGVRPSGHRPSSPGFAAAAAACVSDASGIGPCHRCVRTSVLPICRHRHAAKVPAWPGRRLYGFAQVLPGTMTSRDRAGCARMNSAGALEPSQCGMITAYACSQIATHRTPGTGDGIGTSSAGFICASTARCHCRCCRRKRPLARYRYCRSLDAPRSASVFNRHAGPRRSPPVHRCSPRTASCG